MLEKCPFCHHTRAEIYRAGQELKSGGRRDVYACSECGTLYPRPRPDAAGAREHLSSAAPRYEDPSKAEGNDPLLGLLRKHAPRRGKALDIGASSGSFCRLLEGLGFEAHGLEPQEGARKIAAAAGLRVHAGSFPSEVPGELVGMRFALVSMLESIYYLVDLEEGLTRASDLLEDRGLLLVKCHQGRSGYYDGGSSLFRRFGDHVQGIPTLQSLRHCLAKTGFEVVHLSGSGPASDGLLGRLLSRVRDSLFLDLDKADRLVVLAAKR